MLMGVLLGCIIESVFGKLCRIRREISFVVSMVTWRMLLFSKVRRMLFCREITGILCALIRLLKKVDCESVKMCSSMD